VKAKGLVVCPKHGVVGLKTEPIADVVEVRVDGKKVGIYTREDFREKFGRCPICRRKVKIRRCGR